MHIPVHSGQIPENFVIAEFEKRRKLGMIPCDRLYYSEIDGVRLIPVAALNRGYL